MYHCRNCLEETQYCNCGDYDSVWLGDGESLNPNKPNKPIPYTPVEVTIIVNEDEEKIIDESLPDIIKERMKEENTKVRIRNKRKSIREMLGR